MFRISWVLRDELAVGPAPTNQGHISLLVEEGIAGALILCGEDEAPQLTLENRLISRRFVLPDHRFGRAPRSDELQQALSLLAELRSFGAVYVHCKAGVERSPLICLGWLMQRYQLKQIDALDYLMQVHPRTGVLPEQLQALSGLL